MDKQIIEIGSDGLSLSIKHGFLCITSKSEQKQVPLDMVLSIIVSAYDTVISKNTIPVR